MAFSTFPDLAAFLLVYMARADGQVHYLEEASLTQELRHFANDPDRLIQQASRICEENRQTNVEDVMKVNQTLIGSVSFSERMDLVESLYGIINADGRVQEEEMRTLRAIRTALEQSEGAIPVA